MKKQYLEIGKIVSLHGLNGTCKVQPWCDEPAFLCEFEVLYAGKHHTPMTITNARVQKNMVLVNFKGVETPEQAEALRGTVLYMNRDEVALDEDTYFIQDLLGAAVIDADDGREYGRLTDILQTGANDVYTVKTPQGKELLVPVIPDVVLEINPDEERIVIRPLKGLFDDAD